MILLHTIAVEPCRWRPERIFRPLPDLLPAIAKTGFTDLEIYEPHATQTGFTRLRNLLDDNGLRAPILSSYQQIAAAENFPEIFDTLAGNIRLGQFEKVRLFPGQGMRPADLEGTERFVTRMQALAAALPEIEFLLETHDGSLADDPANIVTILQQINHPNVALLWQPTVFEEQAARTQLEIQQPHIRHYHLQNRTDPRSFSGIFDGVIPWGEILTKHPAPVSIEFIPGGMTAPADFSLDTALADAWETRNKVAAILK